MGKQDDERYSIGQLCEYKFRFLCTQMASLIIVEQSTFTTYTCPKPINEITASTTPLKFKMNALNNTINDGDVSETLTSVKTYAPYVVGCGIVGGIAGYFTAGTTAAVAFSGCVALVEGKTGNIQSRITDFPKQYGLVIYKNVPNGNDIKISLKTMIDANESNRPKFKIDDINSYIGGFQDILAKMKDKSNVGNEDDVNCLLENSSVVEVYPIYGVGVFNLSSGTFDRDEYKKGMYIVFVAGLYYFFDIMKYVLDRRYTKRYCEDYEISYYEAMLRMKIQVCDICKFAFKDFDTTPFTNLLNNEMESVLDKDFTKSLKINYAEYFSNCQSPSNLLPSGMSNWLDWKTGVGLGVGALGLYGVKKFIDHKNARSNSSSSS